MTEKVHIMFQSMKKKDFHSLKKMGNAIEFPSKSVFFAYFK